jgi:hypothetical protein
MKTVAILAAVLISANAFAGLGDKGLHAPSATAPYGARAAYPNSARYLWALGEIESGRNDMAHGRRGEIGRYQCLKAVWRNATAQPFSAATNSTIAATVTLAIIRQRTGKDAGELTPQQFAVAWHCPSAKHLNCEQQDYIARFTNLTNR